MPAPPTRGSWPWYSPLGPCPPFKTPHKGGLLGYTGGTIGNYDFVSKVIEYWFHKVQTVSFQVNSIPDFLVSFLGCGPETPKISREGSPFLRRKRECNVWCTYTCACAYTHIDTRTHIIQAYTYTDAQHTHTYTYTHIFKGCLAFHSCVQIYQVCVTWGKLSNLCLCPHL